MRGARAIAVAAVLAGPALASAPPPPSAALGPVASAADARAYLDAVFFAHGCAIDEATLLAVMRADGQSPADLTAAQGSASPEKLMRHRWIFRTLQAMREDGELCPDPADPTRSLAKFGACAP
ncbi:MAG: hypothetical protein D6811_11510 [Alphaproteobacteria bacterium]|nr:MAG: hypothetical protein D6811_11510 [Alphaproteobacteria bacterium]